MQEKIHLSKEEKSLKIITSLQKYMNTRCMGKRIIIGVLNSKRVYCVLNRKQTPSKTYASVSIAVKYKTNSPESSDFKTHKLQSMQPTFIAQAIYNELGEKNYEDVEIDVYRSTERKSVKRKKSEYDHLKTPKTASEKRLAKMERKLFNNPKLWKWKDPELKA